MHRFETRERTLALDAPSPSRSRPRHFSFSEFLHEAAGTSLAFESFVESSMASFLSPLDL